MKVLVTGANGFIGKNIIAMLKTKEKLEILPMTRETREGELKGYIEKCDFIIHLAGVNRTTNIEAFWDGNYRTTRKLVDMLNKDDKKVPIIMSSSIQAALDNDYGKSKRAAEDVLRQYGRKNNVPVYIYRLTNVFGKWSKPEYNSVVATFCHHTANDEAIQIHEPDKLLRLVYVDDVIRSFIDILENRHKPEDLNTVQPVFETTVGELAQRILSFRQVKENLIIPDMKDTFTRYLYSTYLSYLREGEHVSSLEMHVDDRGSFTELIKTLGAGQVALNVSKPGAVKGNHWHQTKHEKFIVIKGKGLIQLRKIGCNKIIDYYVDDQNIQVVDIPPGVTHNIINVGDEDLITVIWCNICYDKDNPDTYYEKVT